MRKILLLNTIVIIIVIVIVIVIVVLVLVVVLVLIVIVIVIFIVIVLVVILVVVIGYWLLIIDYWLLLLLLFCWQMSIMMEVQNIQKYHKIIHICPNKKDICSNICHKKEDMW